MSFLTDPSLYSFETPPPECLSCFAANKTPTPLFCSLQGIEIGDTWATTDEPPPNGVFELTFSAACTWSYAVGGLSILYKSALPGSSLLVSVAVGGFVFTDSDVADCIYEFTNFWQSPIGRNYYGGSAVLLNPLDSGSLNNIDLMGLLNMDPTADTWCAMNRGEVGHITNRYTREQDHTNVLIKYELP